MKLAFFHLIMLLGSFSFGQRDTLPPKAQMVGDYFANGYTVIFPLGWSQDGHFAFIYQDVNGRGGADIYKYHMIVHKNKINRPEYISKTTYNLEEDTSYLFLSELPILPEDTAFWGNSFFRNVYWKEHRDSINKVLDAYNIIRMDGNVVKPIESLKKSDMEISVVNERDTENAIILDRKIDIFLHVKNTYKRAIFTKTNALNADGWAIDQYGNYTDLLYYEIGGVIQSPYSDNYLLYLIEYTMGYEETAERLILVPFTKNR